MWWEPCSGGYFWPKDMPRDYSIKTLIRVFESLGYAACDGHEPEPGVQKVAIYAIGSETWEHAAIQTQDGKWSSKIGENIDIAHDTLDGLYGGLPGSEYGKVICVLKKKRSTETSSHSCNAATACKDNGGKRPRKTLRKPKGKRRDVPKQDR